VFPIEANDGGVKEARMNALAGKVGGSVPATGATRPGGATPREEYAARLTERRRREADLGRLERLVGNARVGLFLLALLLAWLAFGSKVLSAWWLLIPVVPSVVLLFVHEAATRRLRRAGRAAEFYEAGIARIDHQWKGKGRQGTRYQDERHPYAADLDLFGPGSLFELLCTARTRAGEDTLASWLLAPARPDVVRARQAAVAELRPLLDLREELYLLAAEVPAGVDFAAVVAWGQARSLLVPEWLGYVALALGTLSLLSVVGWLAMVSGVSADAVPGGALLERVGYLLPLSLLLAQGLFVLWHGGRVQQVLRVVERRARDLGLLASLLARLEETPFRSARLRELKEVVEAGGHGLPPSRRVARLGNLVELLDSRRNQFFAPIAFLLLWGTQIAYAIERWRAASGRAVGGWLAAAGEFEALCALAAYAFENPDDPFPELADEGPLYDGEGLGHPLVPRGVMVVNDLLLSAEMRVLVVSGSNMSGKSTYLRTAGVNAVLAQAGAPVRARRLRLSPLAVGATLRIQDSLQEGRSRFYAEVLRVRQVVELTRGPLPLLFLLDEIFAGTNSHDRRLGAEAVVTGLVRAGAIGLVTTHDLSLTHIVEQVAPRGANIHFADRFEGGVMKFDYRVHEGVVRHSNALALMRAVGLEV
jgi:hypothetical protein